MDDLIGKIVPDLAAPGMSRQRWIDLISGHPNLVRPQPHQGINPFTKGPMVIHPRPDIAQMVIDGVAVGSMSWAEDDSNLINVWGDPQAMVPLAREVANLLGGRFQERRVE
jgi:hypothetical protein